MVEFGTAVFDGDHAVGDIGPISRSSGTTSSDSTASGHRLSSVPRILLKAREAGAGFRALARENSDGVQAIKGGDLGWIAPGQSRDKKIDTVLAALSRWSRRGSNYRMVTTSTRSYSGRCAR
jgi:hypothetical protein